MPSLPLRIALLECDTPLAGTRSRYGGYGGVFTSLLTAAASELKLPSSPDTSDHGLSLSTYEVVTAQEYPDLSSIDGILISGSKHNSFDNDPWIVKLVDFVKTCFENKKRVIGVCFGHQIVGRALGVKVARSDKGWEASVTAIDLTKRGQEIFGRPSIALHQMHKDIVYDYPEGVEELAYTDKCAVQGMYVKGKLITVQGHPEFTGEIVRELLVARHDAGVFDDAIFEDAMGRVDKYHDGVVVAQAFLRFMMDA